MPPEFAQHLQQLFARQMAVAFLEHCGQLEVQASQVSQRLDQLGSSPDASALRAEFE